MCGKLKSPQSTMSGDGEGSPARAFLDYFKSLGKLCISRAMSTNGIVWLSIQHNDNKVLRLDLKPKRFDYSTVEPLLYDHPQNHISVVV